MAFSTAGETRTLLALTKALRPHGFDISQKSRVLDVVEAAAALPEATSPAGSSSGKCLNLGETLPPVLRAKAGPLGPNHPWLLPGDWDYAWKSHFDFVVHAPLGDRYQTHPLFAVEFDGPTHESHEVRQRDYRKNRLCVASGLPLVRIDDAFLRPQQRLVLVQWLAELWVAHRQEMPILVAERDQQIEAMTDRDREEMGSVLIPDLDVNLLFQMGHPYPPTLELAQQLDRRFGFHWSWIRAKAERAEGSWRVATFKPPVDRSSVGLIQRWACSVRLSGPDERMVDIVGRANTRSGYPLGSSASQTTSAIWAAIHAGRMPYLPAGPWLGTSSVVGEVLCLHDALRNIGMWLERQAGEPT